MYSAPLGTGHDDFSYVVQDASGQSGQGKVLIEVLGTDRTFYRAEDGIRSEATFENQVPGCTGTGLLRFDGTGSIEWTVTARTATTARLVLRYFGELAGSADVRVNGGAAVQVALPFTGWAAWSASEPIAIALQAGANTVRVSPSGGQSIDRVEVVWEEPAAGNGPPRVPTGLIARPPRDGGAAVRRLAG